MSCLLWIGGISAAVVILFGYLIFDIERRGRARGRGHAQTRAVSNARQLGLALFEFENEYGRYPDSTTAPRVTKDTGSTLTLSNRTSNDLFAQLLVSGMAPDEHMFCARTKGTLRNPDNVFNSDVTILAHGECIFAYISGLSATNANTPLVFGPVIPGTATLDREFYDGKAFILRTDNSVTSAPIDSSGKIIYNGLDLLDPRQPYWHGKAPDVKWPK